MFSRYANTKESVDHYRKDDKDGKINANFTKSHKMRRAYQHKEMLKNGEYRNKISVEEGNQQTRDKPPRDYICISCGKQGWHYMQNCEYKERRCYECGKPGHMKIYCPVISSNKEEDEESERDISTTKKNNANTSYSKYAPKANIAKFHEGDDDEDLDAMEAMYFG